jgi:hypothetical protein
MIGLMDRIYIEEPEPSPERDKYLTHGRFSLQALLPIQQFWKNKR